MSMVISLIELWKGHAEALDELDRSERFSLKVQVCEKLFSCLSHQFVIVKAHLRVLVALKRIFQLIHSLQSLDCRVHIACVSKIL